MYMIDGQLSFGERSKAVIDSVVDRVTLPLGALIATAAVSLGIPMGEKPVRYPADALVIKHPDDQSSSTIVRVADPHAVDCGGRKTLFSIALSPLVDASFPTRRSETPGSTGTTDITCGDISSNTAP